ncbi:MAG: hypothetical protein HQM06_16705 [Magnetococcales bacterium]|nr:hypothetical protein [Magnetococcales bacterium]
MSKNTIEVDGQEIVIKEMTVADMESWLETNTTTQSEPDLVGDLLFEEVSLRDVLLMTEGVTRSELSRLTPSQIAPIVQRCRTVNPAFFARIRDPLQRIRARQLGALLSSSASSDDLPAPWSAPDMPMSGSTPGGAS